MLKKKTLLRLTAIVVLLPILVLSGFSLMSRPPTNLGVIDGQLAPCPNSPNCVSSQATDAEHKIAPIQFSGDPQAAYERLKNTLATIPRTRIITEKDDYLHAESVSLIFRFVDDLEFYLDREEHLIHVRSASRVGRSDLGVNRKRMETIRQFFENR